MMNKTKELSDNTLLEDLCRNHITLGRNESIYSRAYKEIIQLRQKVQKLLIEKDDMFGNDFTFLH